MSKEDKKMIFKTAKTVVITVLVVFSIIGIKDTFFEQDNEEYLNISNENSNTDNYNDTYESKDNEVEYIEEEPESTDSEEYTKLKEKTLKKVNDVQQERRKSTGDALTTSQQLEVMQTSEIPIDIESQFGDDEVFFIPNGYYYHSDIYCKGLKGYYDIKYTTISDTGNLKPCNWCN